jgi:hypothetical protein
MVAGGSVPPNAHLPTFQNTLTMTKSKPSKSRLQIAPAKRLTPDPGRLFIIKRRKLKAGSLPPHQQSGRTRRSEQRDAPPKVQRRVAVAFGQWRHRCLEATQVTRPSVR